MKKTIIVVLLCTVPFIFSSCHNLQPTITEGCIISDFTTPLMCPSSDVTYTKIGKSDTYSILGLVALGNGSLQKAAKNGGIKKIKMVDLAISNYAYLYINYTTIVYGD